MSPQQLIRSARRLAATLPRFPITWESSLWPSFPNRRFVAETGVRANADVLRTIRQGATSAIIW